MPRIHDWDDSNPAVCARCNQTDDGRPRSRYCQEEPPVTSTHKLCKHLRPKGREHTPCNQCRREEGERAIAEVEIMRPVVDACVILAVDMGDCHFCRYDEENDKHIPECLLQEYLDACSVMEGK